jgi:uncharacterized protein (DUF2252 family)
MKKEASIQAAKTDSFAQLNTSFENWLRTQCHIVEEDLTKKHQRMRANAFNFMRATYFSWASHIEFLCPELVDAPKVLAVGDLHVENFGTWRDGDGRLVWGINDFDEAATMPYVWDLVRLSTSALLSPTFSLSPAAASMSLLKGYVEGLANPSPSVLDQQNRWIRDYVQGTKKSDIKFWAAQRFGATRVCPTHCRRR